MQLRINKMKLSNFMGVKELEIVLNGKDAIIAGENGTGKTTIKTAFSWVLFDKNTFGETKFGIKPVDSEGNPIHNLETSVEIEFDIDGVTNTYKRSMVEKWTRKRGAATATFSGNENSYFINGIPKKKTEYNSAISELISEDVFKTITDPLYFNEQIDWKNRRVMLMDICGNISDDEVISANPELAPLKSIIPTMSVEEHSEICKSSMKNINSELGLIPAKITEAERAIPYVSDISISLSELEKLESQADSLRAKKSEIVNGAELVKLKAEKRDLEKRLDFKPFDITTCSWYKEKCELEKELKEERESHNEFRRASISESMKIEDIDKAKKVLSKEWDEVSSKVFSGETCPTCGQSLPSNEIEKKRKAFNIKKSEQLDEIEERLNKYNIDLEKAKKNVAYNEKMTTATSKSIESLTIEIEKLDVEIEKAKTEYNTVQEKNIANVRAKIDVLSDKIENYDRNIAESIKPIENELQTVTEQINKIQEDIALVKTADRQKERIAELQKEQITLSELYMSYEQKLYLCEQFTKQKVEMLNEKINSKFKVARFKLFDVQVNGGLVETCETTYLGVPYKDMNNAARVNVGLEIINVLCEHKGVTAPIFLDNMESVNNPVKTDSQQVRLYVSKDKTLKIEIGE